MESKVIVITGASGAIGAAAAKRLSTDGHQVIVVGCSPSKTEAVAREIGSDFHVADFTKLAEVHTLAERLLKKYPRIDVLANKGADTLVFLAEGRPGVDFPSGKYFHKRKIDIPNKQAYNRALARLLWNRSENMIESFCGHTAGVSSGQRHW